MIRRPPIYTIQVSSAASDVYKRQLRDLTKKEMRKFLNLEQSSFVLKLNGMRRFSLDEAIQLQENFFPDVSINQLFQHDWAPADLSATRGDVAAS